MTRLNALCEAPPRAAVPTPTQVGPAAVLAVVAELTCAVILESVERASSDFARLQKLMSGRTL